MPPAQHHQDEERFDDLEKRVARNEGAIKILVETSVAEGIRQAVADPKTWDAFFGALATRASREAGKASVSGLKWVALRVFWGTAAGLILYYIGGWGFLAAAIKALGSSAVAPPH